MFVAQSCNTDVSRGGWSRVHLTCLSSGVGSVAFTSGFWLGLIGFLKTWRFPSAENNCCCSLCLASSWSVPSFSFSLPYISFSLKLPNLSFLSLIIITKLSSQSKAPLSLLWFWPLNFPRLFLPFPLQSSPSHSAIISLAAGETWGGRRRNFSLLCRVLGWQIAAVMNVCDSSALHTPGILIEFFISLLQEHEEGRGECVFVSRSVFACLC